MSENEIQALRQEIAELRKEVKEMPMRVIGSAFVVIVLFWVASGVVPGLLVVLLQNPPALFVFGTMGVILLILFIRSRRSRD